MLTKPLFLALLLSPTPRDSQAQQKINPKAERPGHSKEELRRRKGKGDAVERALPSLQSQQILIYFLSNVGLRGSTDLLSALHAVEGCHSSADGDE